MSGVSANAYMQASANSDYTSPIVWSEEAEKYIYESAVFQALGVNDPRHLNKPGHKGYYTLESGFSMGRLTEGVPTPISALSFGQVEILFYAYGDAKQVTWENIVQSFDYVMGDLQYGAIGAMVENRDSEIVAELMNTSATGVYPNAHASGTIVAADTFNTDMIADVETLMEESQGKKCRAIVVHPRQKNSLVKLDNFTDASKLGSDRVIRSGMIGDYIGIDIMVSNHITTATENSITVYKAIALG